MPLLSAIAGFHCWVPLGAIAGCHCWMLATNFGGVHVGCHCWVAIAGCHAGVPLLGAIARCHCCVPLRGKIDRSVIPFSAAPFSILITQKLVCAIWGLCWYNLFLNQNVLSLNLYERHSATVLLLGWLKSGKNQHRNIYMCSYLSWAPKYNIYIHINAYT